MFNFLLYPQEGINYEFILQVYLVCVALLFILYILEKTELMVIAKGLYIVFMPFTVSTLWALYMRSQLFPCSRVVMTCLFSFLHKFSFYFFTQTFLGKLHGVSLPQKQRRRRANNCRGYVRMMEHKLNCIQRTALEDGKTGSRHQVKSRCLMQEPNVQRWTRTCVSLEDSS